LLEKSLEPEAGIAGAAKPLAIPASFCLTPPIKARKLIDVVPDTRDYSASDAPHESRTINSVSSSVCV